MSADNNSKPVLETRNLSVRYGKVEALREIGRAHV